MAVEKKIIGDTFGAEQQELNPDYLRTVEALEKAGLTVFRIEPKSLAQMLTDEVDRPYFGYVVSPSDKLRGYTPEATDVAIDTRQVKIANSNNKNQARQIKMVTQWGEELKQNTGLTDQDISVRMPHAAEVCQLDITYQKQSKEKLYPDFWVRTLDEVVGPRVAVVGRLHPVRWLRVNDWNAGHDHPGVWASPVVVILHQKLKIG